MLSLILRRCERDQGRVFTAAGGNHDKLASVGAEIRHRRGGRLPWQHVPPELASSGFVECRERYVVTADKHQAAFGDDGARRADGAEPIRPARPVTYGDRVAPTLHWTPDAEARLRRIPSFVRGVVVRRLEDHARAHGRTEITVELLREVRERMPVDFSKRRPFFLDDH